MSKYSLSEWRGGWVLKIGSTIREYSYMEDKELLWQICLYWYDGLLPQEIRDEWIERILTF